MSRAMGSLFASFICSLLVESPIGCGQKMTDFQNAKSIKIAYLVKKQWKYVTVSDAKEVKEILATISVDYIENSAPGWIVRNNVSFQLPEDKEIKVFIARKGILDRPDQGLIHLKDTKFYDKVNEILTKREGRKIDVLVDNE